MEKVVLQTNLRYLLEGMNEAEIGRLFLALLAEKEEGLSEKARGMYQYILSLQQELAIKTQKMRLLGAKGAAARKQREQVVMQDLFSESTATLTDAVAALPKRKVTKEKNINNKIKKISSAGDLEKQGIERRESEEPFVPPKVDEVRDFVCAEGLNVEPEVFVDFYESHGWCVGKTQIKNWRATVRLWHRRAAKRTTEEVNGDSLAFTRGEAGADVKVEKKAGVAVSKWKPCESVKKTEDELYWHELMERVGYDDGGGGRKNEDMCGDKRRAAVVCEDESVCEDLKESAGEDVKDESPFARFMRRIEDNDLLREERK